MHLFENSEFFKLLQFKETLSNELLKSKVNDYDPRTADDHRGRKTNSIKSFMEAIYAIGICPRYSDSNTQSDYALTFYVQDIFSRYREKIENIVCREYGRDWPIQFYWGTLPSFAACNPHGYRAALSPGISCSADTPKNVGTLGFFCKKRDLSDDSVYICSNNHVLANTNQLQLGHRIVQPSTYENDPNRRGIATLSEFVPLDSKKVNLVDAAIAKVDINVPIDKEICCLGKVNGYQSVTGGMKVKFHGRSSGISEGIVVDVSHDSFVGPYFFENQIRIGPPPGLTKGLIQGGDSGALVLNSEENFAIGLIFALNDNYALANRIEIVLNILGVDIL